MGNPVTAELREVLAHYDLGDLVDYERNERGFVNTSYEICMLAGGERKRYFLRKYKHGIGEEELRFEHSLIQHLVSEGAPVASIHLTRSGETYVLCPRAPGDPVEDFYTLFDYLPGEDRFTWVNPLLTEPELAASAAVLAQLHISARDFNPRGRRVEPRILDLLPVVAETWSGCAARSKGTIFDARIAECQGLVGRSIATTLSTLGEPEARSLPEMMIHCDYHPGNLKFTGESVTGVFDFDWSKRDFRLFDLGLALWYFCTSWAKHDGGAFRLEHGRTFLRTYHECFSLHPGSAVLTPAEARYLPIMINAGNLYVLHWTILDYFAKEVDPAEYLVFLDHSLDFSLWFNQPANRRSLESMIASVLLPAA